MGYALGVCGLTFEDFCLLTPFEFSEVVAAVHERDEALQREAWEQLRVLGTISVSPWSKGNLRPSDVLPLPWDGKQRRDEAVHRVEDKAAARRRFEALMARRKG